MKNAGHENKSWMTSVPCVLMEEHHQSTFGVFIQKELKYFQIECKYESFYLMEFELGKVEVMIIKEVITSASNIFII